MLWNQKTLFKNTDMQVGEIIHRNGERLVCVRVRENGLHTFQVIDLEGEPVIIPYEKGLLKIKDHGIRLIRYESNSN